MDEETRIKFTENVLDTAYSLQSSAHEAGGFINIADLKHMTASHLLEIMALNSLRVIPLSKMPTTPINEFVSIPKLRLQQAVVDLEKWAMARCNDSSVWDFITWIKTFV